jgi:hypothetical protein
MKNYYELIAQGVDCYFGKVSEEEFKQEFVEFVLSIDTQSQSNNCCFPSVIQPYCMIWDRLIPSVLPHVIHKFIDMTNIDLSFNKFEFDLTKSKFNGIRYIDYSQNYKFESKTA